MAYDHGSSTSYSDMGFVSRSSRRSRRRDVSLGFSASRVQNEDMVAPVLAGATAAPAPGAVLERLPRITTKPTAAEMRILWGPKSIQTVDVVKLETFECSICLEETKPGVVRLECDHQFHDACLLKAWFSLYPTRRCPICRTKFNEFGNTVAD